MEVLEQEQQLQLLVLDIMLVHGLIPMEIFGSLVDMDMIILLLVSFFDSF